MTTVTTPQGVTAYQYDAADRLLSVTEPNGETVSYAYDDHGRRTSLTYPNGKTVKYEYDDMDRLVSVKGLDGKTTRYEYDVLGRRIRTDGAKADTAYAYDAVGNLVSQTTKGAYDLALEYTSMEPWGTSLSAVRSIHIKGITKAGGSCQSRKKRNRRGGTPAAAFMRFVR